jgi:hypothetical protein
MAFTELYVQPGGSNLNAGSTTGNAAAFTYAGGTFVRATGVYTPASGNPLADGVTVGMLVSTYTTAGATQAGLVAPVTNVTATNFTVSTTALSGATANVSETAAAATAKVGGAWAGPSGAVAFPFNFVAAAMVVGNNPPRVNIKGGTTYEITAAMTHSLNGPVTFEGYTTTPGDGGLAKFGGDSASPSTPYVMLTVSGSTVTRKNLWFDDNGGTTAGQTVNGMVDITGTGNKGVRCRYTNAYRDGLRVAGGGYQSVEEELYDNQRDDASAHGNLLVTEEATFDSLSSYYNGSMAGKTDSSCVVVSADSTEPVVFLNPIFKNAGAHCIEMTGNHHAVTCVNGIFYKPAQHGIHTAGAAATGSANRFKNNIFIGGQLGVSAQNASQRAEHEITNNAFQGQSTGQVDTDINSSFVTGSISLSADPFVDGENGDFRLNMTAGLELLCQGRASFLLNTTNLSGAGNTVGRPDIGAVQLLTPTPAQVGADTWTYPDRTTT